MSPLPLQPEAGLKGAPTVPSNLSHAWFPKKKAQINIKSLELNF